MVQIPIGVAVTFLSFSTTCGIFHRYWTDYPGDKHLFFILIFSETDLQSHHSEKSKSNLRLTQSGNELVNPHRRPSLHLGRKLEKVKSAPDTFAEFE